MPRYNDTATNELRSLGYFDPTAWLSSFDLPALTLANLEIPPEEQLRGDAAKAMRETLAGCLFALGLSKRFGYNHLFAYSEKGDRDGALSWNDGPDTAAFAPVQIKEIVPHECKTQVDLQSEIDKLAPPKYDNDNLTMLVHINRTDFFDFAALKVSHLRVGGLWFVYALGHDERNWCLLGDMLDKPFKTQFIYPLGLRDPLTLRSPRAP